MIDEVVVTTMWSSLAAIGVKTPLCRNRSRNFPPEGIDGAALDKDLDGSVCHLSMVRTG